MVRSGWHVESLGARDYPEIIHLWRQAGLPIKPAGRDSEEQFNKQIARGTQITLGVRCDGRLVGVVLATHDGRKGWINRLAVHPDFRRQGLGTYLIEAAEKALRAEGYRIIAALIEDWNTGSLALFERAGYHVHRDVYYLTKRDSDDV